MPKLYVADGTGKKNRAFELRKRTIFIGRSASNDVQIPDLTVSRKHLKMYTGGQMRIFYIEDLNSTNGTFIGDNPMKPGEAYQVNEKDIIIIGNTLLRLKGVPMADPFNITGKNPRKSNGNPTNNKQQVLEARERRLQPSVNVQFFSKTARHIRQTLSVDEIIEKILRLFFDALPRIDKAAIIICDGEKGQTKKVIARSRKGQGNGAFRYNETLLNRALEHRKAIKISSTIYATPPERSEKTDRSQIRSAMCVPMLHNSKVRGGIYLESFQGYDDGFRKEDHLVVQRLSSLVGATIDKASLLIH